MKRIVAGLMVLAVVLLLSSSVRAERQSESGRYLIYTSPVMAKLTFLLDTQTGKVWQVVEDKNGNTVWQEMRKE